MTPTKAHDQFMPALQEISKSLTMYGHGPIEIVFTDNPRFQVNTRLNSIMSTISQSEFYVALDMEWSVNRELGIQGRVAVISMTYGREIFLIPVRLSY